MSEQISMHWLDASGRVRHLYASTLFTSFDTMNVFPWWDLTGSCNKQSEFNKYAQLIQQTSDYMWPTVTDKDGKDTLIKNLTVQLKHLQLKSTEHSKKATAFNDLFNKKTKTINKSSKEFKNQRISGIYFRAASNTKEALDLLQNTLLVFAEEKKSQDPCEPSQLKNLPVKFRR